MTLLADAEALWAFSPAALRATSAVISEEGARCEEDVLAR
jgi:hypothetical protein